MELKNVPLSATLSPRARATDMCVANGSVGAIGPPSARPLEPSTTMKISVHT